jgi:hypothetical protein
MNEIIAQNLGHLLYILRAPVKLRAEFLNTATERIIIIFCEFFLNIYFGQIEISEAEKLIFIRYKPFCIKLTKESGSLKIKRELICDLNSEVLNVCAQVIHKYV